MNLLEHAYIHAVKNGLPVESVVSSLEKTVSGLGKIEGSEWWILGLSLVVGALIGSGMHIGGKKTGGVIGAMIFGAVAGSAVLKD